MPPDRLVLDGPRDLPWGRSAYVRDPDGRLVELRRRLVFLKHKPSFVRPSPRFR